MLSTVPMATHGARVLVITGAVLTPAVTIGGRNEGIYEIGHAYFLNPTDDHTMREDKTMKSIGPSIPPLV